MQNLLKYLVAFSILIFSFYCGYIGKIPIMIASSIIFIFLVFMYNLEKFSEIRATTKGFEAKTRDIIKEAEITIKELQNLGKTLVRTELSLVMRNGRIGGYPEDEKDKVKKSIINILNELNVPEDEQGKIFDEEWNRFIVFDYVMGILGNGRIPQDFTEGEKEEWKDLRQDILNDPPSPDKIEKFLVKCDCLSNERSELIEDYRFFLKEKEHRRPEIWKDHQYWEPLGRVIS